MGRRARHNRSPPRSGTLRRRRPPRDRGRPSDAPSVVEVAWLVRVDPRVRRSRAPDSVTGLARMHGERGVQGDGGIPGTRLARGNPLSQIEVPRRRLFVLGGQLAQRERRSHPAPELVTHGLHDASPRCVVGPAIGQARRALLPREGRRENPRVGATHPPTPRGRRVRGRGSAPTVPRSTRPPRYRPRRERRRAEHGGIWRAPRRRSPLPRAP